MRFIEQVIVTGKAEVGDDVGLAINKALLGIERGRAEELRAEGLIVDTKAIIRQVIPLGITEEFNQRVNNVVKYNNIVIIVDLMELDSIDKAVNVKYTVE